MNARILMTLTALFTGLTGLVLLFLPTETALFLTAGTEVGWLLQLFGAVYIGMAILNWMARGLLIGGIYGRPITVGNFTHFAIGTIGLWKSGPAESGGMIVAIVYTGFALAFGYMLFRSPAKSGKN